MDDVVKILRFLRHPPLTFFVALGWLACVTIAYQQTPDLFTAAGTATKAVAFFSAAALLVHFFRWRTARFAMLAEKGLDPADSMTVRAGGRVLRIEHPLVREARLVLRYAAQLYRMAMLRWRWEVCVVALNLTGGALKAVPKLWKMRDDVNNHIHATVRPGSVGANVNAYQTNASDMAGFIRNGCREVLVAQIPGKPGDATVEFAFTDPFDQILDLKDLPLCEDPRRISYGIRRDGSPATLDYSQSVLIGGLTRRGKSVVIKALIADLIRKGIPFALYIADLKDGIEFDEFAPYVGVQNGCMMVADYQSEVDEVVLMLGRMRAEMARRAVVLKEQGVKQWTPTIEHPLMIALIDETLPMKGLLKVDSDAGTIAYTGAGRCVVLWLNSQLGEKAVLGEIRDLIPQRLCFAVQTYQQTNMILGDGAHNAGAESHKLGETKGVGYSGSEGDSRFHKYRAANVTPAQGANLAKGRIPAEMLAESAVGAPGTTSRKQQQARAGKAKAEPDGKRAWLYRAFDDDPRFAAVEGTNLVYIGKHYGVDPQRRYDQHAAAKDGADIKWCRMHHRKENVWLHHAKRIEVVEITTRFGKVEKELMRQERLAIETEFPVFNVHHNRGSVTRRRIKAFLSRGAVQPEVAVDLAVDFDAPLRLAELAEPEPVKPSWAERRAAKRAERDAALDAAAAVDGDVEEPLSGWAARREAKRAERARKQEEADQEWLQQALGEVDDSDFVVGPDGQPIHRSDLR